MQVSIIIPTYQRVHMLLQALKSLQEQTLPDFEILVVDNAADAKVERLVGEFNQSARLPVRYVPEPKLGLHNARHAGAHVANGQILIFTDDDATFDPGWLRAYAKAFGEHPEMAAAGGPVRPVWEVCPPKWLLEFMGDAKTFCPLSLMEPYDQFCLDSRGYFFGVNMAIRRSVFEYTGFRPELFGTRTIGNGETGLNQEISRRGGLIGYSPEAIVYHHIPAHRMTVGYIRKWAWHLGGSEMYERWWNRRRSVTLLITEALIIARQYGRTWLKDYFVRHRRDPSAIHIQFQASLGWCKLNYIWWMLADPKVQAALDMTDFRP
jgi:glycosyltransferase involved in cell wall biosynthesis